MVEIRVKYRKQLGLADGVTGTSESGNARVSVSPKKSVLVQRVAKMPHGVTGLREDFSRGQAAGGASRDFTNQGGLVVFQMMQDIMNPKVEEVMGRAIQVISQTADAHMDLFFNWLARNFMGQRNAGNEVKLGVEWTPLNAEYAKMKGHSGFFVFSGKLRNQMRRKSGLAVFGRAQVTTRATAQTTLRKVVVNLAPKLKGAFVNTPGIPSAYGRRIEEEIFSRGGRFAAGDASILGKLQGKKAYYRALVGPALQHSIGTLLPAEIRRALSNAKIKFTDRRRRNFGAVPINI